MALATFILLPVALAAIPKGHQSFANGGVHTESSMTQTISITNSSATCGVGYTYCGYILKEQKNFDEGTILTAYCAGGFCDSTTGSTKTDHLQALFVCLPESAIPKRDMASGATRSDDPPPYTGPVKIELLCACSGTPFGGQTDVCLNPDGDHVGRCSNACENAS